MKAGKTKLSVNVTVETIDILKEIASEYGSTIGMAVTIIAKDWKREKEREAAMLLDAARD